MPQDYMRALFLLAGIEVRASHQLANCYWPDVPGYAEVRRDNPWWLVETEHGLIKLGWRKRVIEIDWTSTGRRLPLTAITEEDVTKQDNLVHAWGYGKAVIYLQALRRELSKPEATSA